MRVGDLLLMKEPRDVFSYHAKGGMIIDMNEDKLKVLWWDGVVTASSWELLSTSWRVEESI